MAFKDPEDKKSDRKLQGEADKSMRSRLGRMQDRAPETQSYNESEYWAQQRQNSVEKFEDKYFKTLDDLFMSYAQEIAKLKSSVETGIAIVQKAPVMPVLQNARYLDPKLLRTVGIKAYIAAGYTVLDNQILIGIDMAKSAKDVKPAEEYAHKSKEYLDRVHVMQDKVGRLYQIDKELVVIQDELKFLEGFDPTKDAHLHVPDSTVPVETTQDGEDDEYDIGKKAPKQPRDLAKSHELRMASLIAQQAKLDAERKQFLESHAKEYSELAELQEEYKQFKSERREKLQGAIKTGFDKHILEIAKEFITTLNKGLDHNSQLVFPQETPTAIPHGQIMYFWVMRGDQQHQWRKLMGETKIKITDWDIPQHKWGRVKVKVEQELKHANTYVEEILKLRRIGYNHDKAKVKMKAWLIAQRQEMDEAMDQMFEKVWSEADEINKEKKKETSTVRKASSLLSRNNPYAKCTNS